MRCRVHSHWQNQRSPHSEPRRANVVPCVRHNVEKPATVRGRLKKLRCRPLCPLRMRRPLPVSEVDLLDQKLHAESRSLDRPTVRVLTHPAFDLESTHRSLEIHSSWCFGRSGLPFGMPKALRHCSDDWPIPSKVHRLWQRSHRLHPTRPLRSP